MHRKYRLVQAQMSGYVWHCELVIVSIGKSEFDISLTQFVAKLLDHDLDSCVYCHVVV
jgi:hypothetical protein